MIQPKTIPTIETESKWKERHLPDLDIYKDLPSAGGRQSWCNYDYHRSMAAFHENKLHYYAEEFMKLKAELSHIQGQINALKHNASKHREMFHKHFDEGMSQLSSFERYLVRKGLK